MRYISKLLFLILFLSTVGINLHAQQALSATTGLVVNHEELGTEYQAVAFGGHLGFNVYSRKARRFKTELQLSLNFSGANEDQSSIFLSVNALYGVRYYLTDPEKPTSVFVHAMPGVVYIYESGDDFIDNRFGFGYAVGCFADLKRLILGIAAESYNNFILKVGYAF